MEETMNRFHQISLAVVTLIAVAAAPAYARTTTFKAHLTGSESVPTRATQAQGQATLQWNPDQSTFEYKVTVSNIENVVAVQLQHAPSGQTGPVVAVMYGPVAPGGGKMTGILTTGALSSASLVGDLAGQPLSALVSEIQAGKIYINVLTDDGQPGSDERPGDFTSGEIRGQIN
jgi:hypothetical protein